MDIEAVSSVKRTLETTPVSTQEYADRVNQTEIRPVTTSAQQTGKQDPGKEQNMPFDQKEPTKSTVDSMISTANSRITKTRCEYSYDEATKRVSIKVFNKDSDELIREVPPEKSLEVLQKMWELAGFIVDEKR